ncbi:transcriptional regulator [Desulfocucumis palustris]|uniref:Transcriptional regulator n=2 Tax=Desulfocucumis palustris TaxID=1898651 RepID=A0A2L2XBU6_9FIRM|nr:transcriptional regulator [Desulfocucumis palustris]
MFTSSIVYRIQKNGVVLMSILDKAADLGRMLGKSKEYREMKDAEAMLKKDQEAENLIQHFSMLQQSYERMHMTGHEITPEHLEKLKEAEQNMMANKNVKIYYRARGQFNSLFNNVNQKIRENMENTGKS